MSTKQAFVFSQVVVGVVARLHWFVGDSLKECLSIGSDWMSMYGHQVVHSYGIQWRIVLQSSIDLEWRR